MKADAGPPLLAPETRVGNFKIRFRIGEGGFGVVYLARHLRDENLSAAIKVYRQDDERFSEAEVLAKLRHPGIVYMHEGGRHNGWPYLVCELLEGETVHERLRRGPLPWRRAVEIAIAVAAAMAYAFGEEGIAHGDIHPNNVFLAKHAVKLLDFGVAVQLTAERPTAPRRGVPGFMAPEREHDERSDIFSQGMVLYACLTGGRLPPNVIRYTGGRTQVSPAAPAKEDVDALRHVPYLVRRAILRATDPDPARRPRSPRVWLQELRNAQRVGRWLPSPRAVLLLALIAALPAAAVTAFRYASARHHQLRAEIGAIAQYFPQAVGTRDPILSGTVDSLGHLTIESTRERLAQIHVVSGVDFEMVRLPGGATLTGEALPSFLIGRYEVTRRQWRVIANLPLVNRLLLPDPSEFKGSPDLPVQNVSWEDAHEFCERLSRYTGAPYRLPSFAEWTYAVQAGLDAPFASGASLLPRIAVFDCTRPFGSAEPCRQEMRPSSPSPVGRTGLANAFGIFDAHGNVWELIDADVHGMVPIRGGGFNTPAKDAHTAHHLLIEKDQSANDIGFRLAMASDGPVAQTP